MSTSVSAKTRKKPAPPSAPSDSASRELERSLLILENACLRILEGGPVARDDTDARYWQQRLRNMVTPLSLALMEYKGPRRFHYHYRHRADDESILHPVLEPSPLDIVAQVCKDALRQCRNDFVGIQSDRLIRARHMLERALAGFLLQYREEKGN